MNRGDLIIYCSAESKRLKYVLDWLFREVYQLEYTVVSEAADVSDIVISYGTALTGTISIPDGGLLFQDGIRAEADRAGTWQGIPTIFSLPSSCTLPFDLFSALFFLLTRYEEYLPYTADKHDRYPHEGSILYRLNALHRPLVDEWVRAFGELLASSTPYKPDLGSSSYVSSYDIDIAYSLKAKGIRRFAGGLARDLLSGKMADAKERVLVSLGSTQDPFDSFEWILSTHASLEIRPFFFILAAGGATGFDKNNLIDGASMKSLIPLLAQSGQLGLHPSYYSFKPVIFATEKRKLETLTGLKITQSRQHYLRLKIPETYHLLLSQGITDDYSLGYGSSLGFRAGTGRSFPWYDLSKEEVTALRVHPFCFMDTTALFEEGLTAPQAFRKLEEMSSLIEKTGSTLTTVFHNFSLGADPQWTGWKEAYLAFLRKQAEQA